MQHIIDSTREFVARFQDNNNNNTSLVVRAFSKNSLPLPWNHDRFPDFRLALLFLFFLSNFPNFCVAVWWHHECCSNNNSLVNGGIFWATTTTTVPLFLMSVVVHQSNPCHCIWPVLLLLLFPHTNDYNNNNNDGNRWWYKCKAAKPGQEVLLLLLDTEKLTFSPDRRCFFSH